MKTLNIYTISIFLILALAGCQKDDITDENDSDSSTQPNVPNLPDEDEDEDTDAEWLIPKDEVVDGGPGKDGIAALTNPEKVSISDITYLSDDDLVLGFVNQDYTIAYPHPILDWHEIINANVGSRSISIIYCPLTGTGIGWDRIINGQETTFGVSGLLYKSNLIPYDRLTNSNWSQMLLKSVNGSLIGTQSKNYTLFETTYKTWKEMYPNSLIVSTNTGYQRNYSQYPYGTYKTNHDLILFPTGKKDHRLNAKDRVLVVFHNEAKKAFGFNSFSNNISIIEDKIDNTDFIIVGSKDHNFIVAFKSSHMGDPLTFSPLQLNFPAIMIDHEGTSWDAFGRGISGPREGQQLEKATQFIGYWFALSSFYLRLELHSDN